MASLQKGDEGCLNINERYNEVHWLEFLLSDDGSQVVKILQDQGPD